jgi:hypothetical protein
MYDGFLLYSLFDYFESDNRYFVFSVRWHYTNIATSEEGILLENECKID